MWLQTKMTPCGAILHYVRVTPLVNATMMSDDNHVTVGMPAVIAMHFSAGAEMTMAAIPDHDGFSAGDRRRRDSDGGKCGNYVSKLLHAVLLG
jgi:hypothetical protein